MLLRSNQTGRSWQPVLHTLAPYLIINLPLLDSYRNIVSRLEVSLIKRILTVALSNSILCSCSGKNKVEPYVTTLTVSVLMIQCV